MTFETPYYVVGPDGPVRMDMMADTWGEGAPVVREMVDHIMTNVFDTALGCNNADHHKALIVLWMWSRLRTALFADEFAASPSYRMSAAVENFVDAYPGYFSDPVEAGRLLRVVTVRAEVLQEDTSDDDDGDDDGDEDEEEDEEEVHEVD